MIVYIARPLMESWYDHLLDEMEVHTVVPPQLTQKIASKIASSNTSFNKLVFLGGRLNNYQTHGFLRMQVHSFAKASAIFTGSPCK